MSLVEIRFEMPDLAGTLKGQSEKLKYILAATMQYQRAAIFDSEGTYNSRPGWAPLKYRSGQILSDTGTLRKSIGPSMQGIRPQFEKGTIVRYSGDVVTIGTDIAYARIHDQGGVIPAHKIVAQPGKTLSWIHNGQRRFAKSVNIPAVTIPRRNFSEINKRDETELADTVANFVADVLNGKVR